MAVRRLSSPRRHRSTSPRRRTTRWKTPARSARSSRSWRATAGKRDRRGGPSAPLGQEFVNRLDEPSGIDWLGEVLLESHGQRLRPIRDGGGEIGKASVEGKRGDIG